MYQLNENYYYIVYGMGKKGKHIAKILEDNHLYVKYFVDKQASNIKYKTEIPILFPEKLSSIKEKHSYIIIISFENALEHDEIASNLFNMGFNNILFFPMFFQNEKTNDILRKTLNELFDGVISHNSIYEYSELYKSINNTLDYNKSEDKIIISMPFEYIYTDGSISPTQDLFSENRVKMQKKYADIPLLFFKPYFEMFHYLDKGKGNCLDYIQMQLKGNKDYQSQTLKILNDRKKLLDLYNVKFNDMNTKQFFLGSASEAQWNEKGYFNLKDGHHRACYLLYRGMTKIPIRVNYKDIKSFSNYLNTSKCITKLPVNNSYRICYPSFYNKIDTGLEYKILKFISSKFTFYDLEEKNFLLSTKHNKYLGIVLAKFLNKNLYINNLHIDETFRMMAEIFKVSPNFALNNTIKYNLVITDSIDELKDYQSTNHFILIHDGRLNLQSNNDMNIELIFDEYYANKMYSIYYINRKD